MALVWDTPYITLGCQTVHVLWHVQHLRNLSPPIGSLFPGSLESDTGKSDMRLRCSLLLNGIILWSHIYGKISRCCHDKVILWAINPEPVENVCHKRAFILCFCYQNSPLQFLNFTMSRSHAHAHNIASMSTGPTHGSCDGHIHFYSLLSNSLSDKTRKLGLSTCGLSHGRGDKMCRLFQELLRRVAKKSYIKFFIVVAYIIETRMLKKTRFKYWKLILNCVCNRIYLIFWGKYYAYIKSYAHNSQLWTACVNIVRL